MTVNNNNNNNNNVEKNRNNIVGRRLKAVIFRNYV